MINAIDKLTDKNEIEYLNVTYLRKSKIIICFDLIEDIDKIPNKRKRVEIEKAINYINKAIWFFLNYEGSKKGTNPRKKHFFGSAFFNEIRLSASEIADAMKYTSCMKYAYAYILVANFISHFGFCYNIS